MTKPSPSSTTTTRSNAEKDFIWKRSGSVLGAAIKPSRFSLKALEHQHGATSRARSSHSPRDVRSSGSIGKWQEVLENGKKILGPFGNQCRNYWNQPKELKVQKIKCNAQLRKKNDLIGSNRRTLMKEGTRLYKLFWLNCSLEQVRVCPSLDLFWVQTLLIELFAWTESLARN